MKFWVLVGLGPNSVEVPCMVFSSLEALLAKVVPILGEPKKYKKSTGYFAREEGMLYWNVDFESVENKDDDDDDSYGDDYNLSMKFYTGYYGGCGECYRLEVREVTEGKPFVGFDLD